MTTFFNPVELALVLPPDASLLLALDFDGTLAHLVDNPDDARMTAQARTALGPLTAHPDTVIAIVSGRGAANLREVAMPDSAWWLVGSHGMEIIPPGHDVSPVFDDAFLAQRAAVWEGFSEVAKEFPGAWVEKKTFGAALHTRGVAKDVEVAAHDALWPVITAIGDDLTTRTGHGILETSIGEKTKGDGITLLREEVAPDITVFIGDDVTDEDGFRALLPGDVGIKVGNGTTHARYRLDGPDAVGRFLETLATRQNGVG